VCAFVIFHSPNDEEPSLSSCGAKRPIRAPADRPPRQFVARKQLIVKSATKLGTATSRLRAYRFPHADDHMLECDLRFSRRIAFIPPQGIDRTPIDSDLAAGFTLGGADLARPPQTKRPIGFRLLQRLQRRSCGGGIATS